MSTETAPDTDAVAPAEAPPSAWRPPAHNPARIAAIVASALAAVLVILYAWQLPPFAGLAEETDNAAVAGKVTVISPQVSGYVTAVPVADFAQVRAGDVLATIDDRIYAARVAQAQAQVDAAGAALANSRQAEASRGAALESQAAGIDSARAQLARAQNDMRRADDLVRDGSISARERDQTRAALLAAEAQVRQASAAQAIGQQDLRSVQVGRGGQQASVEAAQAALRLARIDLDNTRIRAPEDGQVSQLGVRKGAFVSAGTQLMFLVPRDVWVIANLKEAQTGGVAVGQHASFKVDALGGRRFTGRVSAIAPAAGSEFAVLKADNATGNFVKVPQRIAVKIAIDPGQSGADRLRPGMSVEARLDTRP